MVKRKHNVIGTIEHKLLKQEEWRFSRAVLRCVWLSVQSLKMAECAHVLRVLGVGTQVTQTL